MKVGVVVYFQGLEEDELRFLMRKHCREFGVTIGMSSPLASGMYFQLRGKLENIVNMCDFLAHNGFTIELVSAKEG